MSIYGSTDFYYQLALGQIPGVSIVQKFGRNPALPNGTREEIWDGSAVYSFPATADITHLVSTAADTQDVEVQGLDEDWAEVTQTKTLTGTTPVALDTPLIRIFRMRVDDTTDPTGDITAENVGGTTTYAQITAPYNQTLMALYTVPAGKEAVIDNYYFSINKKTSAQVEVELYVRPFGKVFNLKHILTASSTGTSTYQHLFKSRNMVSEKGDIVIRGLASAADVDLSAGFDLILENA